MGEPHWRAREVGFPDREDPDEGARQLQGTYRSQFGSQILGKGLTLKFVLQRTTIPPQEYILAQACLRRDAHFDDKAKHEKPVPMGLDAPLAKVTALKEGRGESCEASDVHGTEPPFL